MDFETIRKHLDGIPFITAKQGRKIYDFVLAEKPQRCLELGIGHGVSSCYTAAALHAIGRGKLDSVDLIDALQWQKPSLEELLIRTGLSPLVTVHREKTSYTWYLKKVIEAQTVDGRCRPLYDFCFLDGCKNWTVDGFAFMLVDKLLRPGGWILFDDYLWTYDRHADGRTVTDGIVHRELGDDERTTPHIKLVFDYLVRQKPDYRDFKVEGDWAWAHKVAS